MRKLKAKKGEGGKGEGGKSDCRSCLFSGARRANGGVDG